MANKKVSALPVAPLPLQITDTMYVIRAGTSLRTPLSSLYLDLLTASPLVGNTRRTIRDLVGDEHNVKFFGAVGDGASHLLSGSEATDFNNTFGSYGLVVSAGDEKDWAAIMAAMLVAASTGKNVYIPVGTYYINKPLTLEWTATPDANKPARPKINKIYGDGTSTVIYAKNIAATRGAVEIIGEANAYAANIEISNLQIEQDVSCNVLSYCLRITDAYCGAFLYRVVCKGANGLSLGVASSVAPGYAQICFRADQCQFWSNWDLRWGADNGSMVAYSLNNESLGARWDSALFTACFFWGQANPRAFTLKFETCIFVTPPDRAVPDNVVVYIGSAAFDNCYFEDHRIGVVSLSETSDIPSVVVRNSHFSSANNLGSVGNAQSAIQCGRTNYQHGPVLIENCRFGTTHTGVALDFYGPLSVEVKLPGGLFVDVNEIPTISKNGDVRIVMWGPNDENAYDFISYDKVRIQCPIFSGTSEFQDDSTGQPTLKINNTNNSTGASAGLVAETNGSFAKIIAFGPTHSSFPNEGWFTSELGDIVIGPRELERLRVGDVQVRAKRDLNGVYGFTAENAHAGASAIAFSYASNGTDFTGMLCYGTAHPLAGQGFIGTATAKKFHLGAGALFDLTFDPSDRRIRIRDYGALTGNWYTQTTTQSVSSSTSEVSLTFGGQGLLTIPASTLQVGSQIELDVVITEAAAVAVTYTHRIYAGNVLASTLTGVFGGVSAAAPRSIRMRGTVKTLGATGTMDYVLYDEGAAVAFGTHTIDTTGTLTFYLSSQPNANNAGNIVTCPQASLKVLI